MNLQRYATAPPPDTGAGISQPVSGLQDQAMSMEL